MYRLLFICLLLLTSCSGVTIGFTPAVTAVPCATQARAYMTVMQPLATEWDDAAKLAGSTARISLSPAIARLQDIRRRAQQVAVPPCVDTANTTLIQAMNEAIDGYIAFMSQAPQANVSAQLTRSNTDMGGFLNQMAALVQPTTVTGPHDTGGPVLIPAGDGAPQP